MLNELRRRSFLSVALMSLVFPADSFPSSFKSMNEPATPAALTLMRTLNTIQAGMTTASTLPDGTLAQVPASRADMLAALAKQVRDADPQTAAGAFLKTLVPNDRNGEIVPGWITDIDIKKNGYVIITSQKVDPANPNAKREAFISDETGLICRARINGPVQPSAGDLNHGIDFPGAVPHDLFRE